MSFITASCAYLYLTFEREKNCALGINKFINVRQFLSQQLQLFVFTFVP